MIWRTFLALILALSPSAGSADLLGNLNVEVLAEQNPYHSRLMVGDTEVVDALYVYIIEIGEVAGVPILIGSAGYGGSGDCHDYFVVSLQQSKLRLSDKVDICWASTPPKIEVGTDFIRFSALPGVGTPGMTWNWHPTTGMDTGTVVEFAPNPSLSWGDLLRLENHSTEDVFAIPEIWQAVNAIPQPSRDQFLSIVGFLHFSMINSEDYIADGCVLFNCVEGLAFIYLDTSEQKFFAAWAHQHSSGITFEPKHTNTWTEDARTAVEVWKDEIGF